jgi:hypothetical protein
MFLELYRKLVRLQLEHAVQARRLYLQKDINLLEKVQWRATKLTDSLRDQSHNERYKTLIKNLENEMDKR